MYAIIDTGGKQIKVSSGDEVIVDKLMGDVNSEIVIDRVLMISDEGKAVFGRPYIEGARVKAEILGTSRMRKVLILKHVPKKAHEKLTGHRQLCTTLKIKEIIGG